MPLNQNKRISHRWSWDVSTIFEKSYACAFPWIECYLLRTENTLSENNGPLKTTLRENETTLIENRPRTSGLDHINENDGGSIQLGRQPRLWQLLTLQICRRITGEALGQRVVNFARHAVALFRKRRSPPFERDSSACLRSRQIRQGSPSKTAFLAVRNTRFTARVSATVA